MKKIFSFLLIVSCGSATNAFAKEDDKGKTLNELNPITRYVNVCQESEGKEKKFILCDSKDKSCVQPESRTTKHLATAK